MATAPDGRFVVAWVSDGQDGGGKGVFARLYDANGAPQTGEILVNTTTANDQEQPAVAMDGAGNFVVVWSGNGMGDGDGVFAQRFNAAGVPQGTEFRVNGAVSVGFNQSDPDIAMETNGDFAVVWQSNETSSIEIWLQRYQANGTAIGGAEPRIGQRRQRKRLATHRSRWMTTAISSSRGRATTATTREYTRDVTAMPASP